MPTEIEWLERINPVDATTLDQLSEGAMARSLLNEIVRAKSTVPRMHPGRRRRTWITLVAAVAACVVAACVVLATGALESKPAAGVTFAEQGDAVIVTITNQMATADELSQAFAEHHLDIAVRLIPVSPSEVGRIITQEGPGGATIRPVATGQCPVGDPSCPIRLSISDVQGHSSVDVGRAAQAGEVYASSANVFGPGEVLHCSGLVNASVGEAESYLHARHLSVAWRLSPPGNAGPGGSTTSTSSTTLPSAPVRTGGIDQAFTTSAGSIVKDTLVALYSQSTPLPRGVREFVVDGSAMSSNEVMLFVSPTPKSASEVQTLQSDC